jgi:hypothetical protein
MAEIKQLFAEMRSKKAGAAGHQNTPWRSVPEQ